MGMSEFPIAEVGITLSIVLAFLGWTTKQLLNERRETKKLAREFTDYLKSESDRRATETKNYTKIIDDNTQSNRQMIESIKELTREVRNGHKS